MGLQNWREMLDSVVERRRRGARWDKQQKDWDVVWDVGLAALGPPM